MNTFEHLEMRVRANPPQSAGKIWTSEGARPTWDVEGLRASDGTLIRDGVRVLSFEHVQYGGGYLLMWLGQAPSSLQAHLQQHFVPLLLPPSRRPTRRQIAGIAGGVDIYAPPFVEFVQLPKAGP